MVIHLIVTGGGGGGGLDREATAIKYLIYGGLNSLKCLKIRQIRYVKSLQKLGRRYFPEFLFWALYGLTD